MGKAGSIDNELIFHAIMHDEVKKLDKPTNVLCCVTALAYAKVVCYDTLRFIAVSFCLVYLTGVQFSSC